MTDISTVHQTGPRMSDTFATAEGISIWSTLIMSILGQTLEIISKLITYEINMFWDNNLHILVVTSLQTGIPRPTPSTVELATDMETAR